MNKESLILGLVMLLIGFGLGRAGANSKFLAGKMDACAQVISSVNMQLPPEAQLSCKAVGGEVYITGVPVGNKLIGLNGQEKN